VCSMIIVIEMVVIKSETFKSTAIELQLKVRKLGFHFLNESYHFVRNVYAWVNNIYVDTWPGGIHLYILISVKTKVLGTLYERIKTLTNRESPRWLMRSRPHG
jgi:hypothetical protein